MRVLREPGYKVTSYTSYKFKLQATSYKLQGALALKSYGVDPAIALEAINGGSGMSLQADRRLIK